MHTILSALGAIPLSDTIITTTRGLELPQRNGVASQAMGKIRCNAPPPTYSWVYKLNFPYCRLRCFGHLTGNTLMYNHFSQTFDYSDFPLISMNPHLHRCSSRFRRTSRPGSECRQACIYARWSKQRQRRQEEVNNDESSRETRVRVGVVNANDGNRPK